MKHLITGLFLLAVTFCYSQQKPNFYTLSCVDSIMVEFSFKNTINRSCVSGVILTNQNSQQVILRKPVQINIKNGMVHLYDAFGASEYFSITQTGYAIDELFQLIKTCNATSTDITCTESAIATPNILTDTIDLDGVVAVAQVDLSSNDQVCNCGTTSYLINETYNVTSYAEINVAVPLPGGGFGDPVGDFEFTPTTEGEWRASYTILCDGVPYAASFVQGYAQQCGLSKTINALYHCNNAPIQGAYVLLNGIQVGVTDAFGSYTFVDLCENDLISLSFANDIGVANGVECGFDGDLSSLDTEQEIIIAEILGVNCDVISTVGQQIAADMSGDGTYTTFDNIQIGQLCAGIVTSLPVNWVFIEQNEFNSLIPGTACPHNPLPVYSTTSSITASSLEDTFVGIKMGDVDCTAFTNLNITADVVYPYVEGFDTLGYVHCSVAGICDTLFHPDLNTLLDHFITNNPADCTSGDCCLKYDGVSFYFENCCEDCSVNSIPTIQGTDEDFDALFGTGTTNAIYQSFDLSTLITSSDCEPFSNWTIINQTDASYTGTLPIIEITPTGSLWSIEYEVCCSDGTTCTTGMISGTSVDLATLSCVGSNTSLTNIKYDAPQFLSAVEDFTNDNQINIRLSNFVNTKGTYTNQNMTIDWNDGNPPTNYVFNSGADIPIIVSKIFTYPIYPTIDIVRVNVQVTSDDGLSTNHEIVLALTEIDGRNFLAIGSIILSGNAVVDGNCEDYTFIQSYQVSGSTYSQTVNFNGIDQVMSFSFGNRSTTFRDLYDVNGNLISSNTSTGLISIPSGSDITPNNYMIFGGQGEIVLTDAASNVIYNSAPIPIQTVVDFQFD